MKRWLHDSGYDPNDPEDGNGPATWVITLAVAISFGLGLLMGSG